MADSQTIICDKCGTEYAIAEWPWCPHGTSGRYGVIPDDYGRDIVCENMGHEPVVYRTRSERKRLMREHKVGEFVRHVGEPGSDKSSHTSRWV